MRKHCKQYNITMARKMKKNQRKFINSGQNLGKVYDKKNMVAHASNPSNLVTGEPEARGSKGLGQLS